MILGKAISPFALRKKSSGGGVPTDADAQAFITATGISGTNATATNQLVIDLKAANIWTKMKGIYPMVGGTATTCKFNLKDARDLDAAYRLTFFGGGTFSSNGYQPGGVNGYALTFLNPSTQLTLASTHLSYYSRTATPVGVTYEIGEGNGVSNYLALRVAALLYSGNSSTSPTTFATTASAAGFWIGSKRANNDRETYLNGVSQTTQTITDAATYSSVIITLGALNNNGSLTGYSNKQCAFASIGDGLTDAEALAFYNAVQTFNTTLARQV